MKKYFFLLLISPCIVFAQVKKAAVKKKPVAASAVKKTQTDPVKAADGYLIKGNVTGVTDGTSIQIININTGQPEANTVVKDGKFFFAGKMPSPDFKYIGIEGQQPFIILFADNSEINISASKEKFAEAIITGSPTHNDFIAYSKMIKPYENLFSGQGRFDVKYMDEAAGAIEKFITSNKASFITPLAVFKYNQITGDYAKLEEMYNSFDEPVKNSLIGNYLRGMINENKSANYGQPIANFSQADTSGKEISLASFKGKYVLVDFWASWCGPCRAENPNVVNTFEKYKDKNFTVLGVSLDRAKQPWLDAIAADKLVWTHVSDLLFWGNAVAKQFGIQNIPQNFLIDPQGNLVGKNLRGAALEYRLSKVLK